MVIIIIPRGTKILGWHPAGDSYDSWSHGLALVGGLPRDGVLIKILVVVAPHQH